MADVQARLEMSLDDLIKAKAHKPTGAGGSKVKGRGRAPIGLVGKGKTVRNMEFRSSIIKGGRALFPFNSDRDLSDVGIELSGCFQCLPFGPRMFYPHGRGPSLLIA